MSKNRINEKKTHFRHYGSRKIRPIVRLNSSNPIPTISHFILPKSNFILPLSHFIPVPLQIIFLFFLIFSQNFVQFSQNLSIFRSYSTDFPLFSPFFLPPPLKNKFSPNPSFPLINKSIPEIFLLFHKLLICYLFVKFC